MVNLSQPRIARWAVAAGMAAGISRALAVILMGTFDPDANTSAPTGELDGSGWQWIGTFGQFCGTPIGPSSFLTAAHIGGGVGQSFVYDGRSYRTTGFATDPTSDLRVWQVCGEFARHATVDDTEVAKGDGIVVFGRGTQRGDPVKVQKSDGIHVVGWKWGPLDGFLRWGTNTVASLLDGEASGGYGAVFSADFDAGQGNDECTLSVGDSGGPVFVRRADGWRVAGINLAVDGPFRISTNGASFNAALFDAAGLYYEGDNHDWILVPEDSIGASSSFYCTRVALKKAWVDGILAAAPPRARVEASDAWPPVFHAIVPLEHDPVERYFRCAVDATPRVFRVWGAPGIRIRKVTPGDGWVRLDYE